jgi:hypothetical protein
MRAGCAAVATLAAVVVAAGGWAERVDAASNPNGMVFRAVGIFQGPSEEGKCEVPTVGSAIVDVTNGLCRDATVATSDTAAFRCGGGGDACVSDGDCAGEPCLPTGVLYPTVMYPDRTSPFGNFCGGFLELQNNLINQGITVYRVNVRYRLGGQGFPLLCRTERKFRIPVGTRLNPVNSADPSPSGAANTAFMQLLPIFSPALLNCLRDPARGDVSAPVVLIAKLRVLGLLDAGGRIVSNPLQYTLTLLPEGGGGAGAPPGGVPTRCAPPSP